MPDFYTVLTEVGRNKIANAIAVGETITIADLAVGDGGGSVPDPDASRTSLINQVRRAQINRSEVDEDNPSWIVVEQVIPPDVGGWYIREIGIFDAEGDMVAYGNYPETYKPQLEEGSSRTQTVRFVIEVSDTAAVTLKVDASVVLATRQYADDGDTQTAQDAADALDSHAQGRNHPAATESDQGMVRYATESEHVTGDRSDRGAHPAGVDAAIKDKLNLTAASATQRVVWKDGYLATEEVT